MNVTEARLAVNPVVMRMGWKYALRQELTWAGWSFVRTQDKVVALDEILPGRALVSRVSGVVGDLPAHASSGAYSIDSAVAHYPSARILATTCSNSIFAPRARAASSSSDPSASRNASSTGWALLATSL
jgi:hypothetical protein